MAREGSGLRARCGSSSRVRSCDDLYCSLAITQSRRASPTRLPARRVEAILTLADIYERKGDNKQAVQWYRRSLALIEIPALRGEVEKRIAQLSK